jgi:hypothetical protein
MRADFFKEIETNRPAYVVYVNAVSSWISTVLPGHPRQLIDSIDSWWQPYAAQNYRLVGQVDVPDGQPPQYFWDDQMASRTNIGEPNISIFRHK